MKNNQMPDMETIKRYWGSLEAYNEEQRRTALVSLEEEQPNSWKWDFKGRKPNTNDLSNKTQNGSNSFRLFGRNS